MSLATSIRQGVQLIGLAPLLNGGGGVVGNNSGQVSQQTLIGSYDVIGATIVFYANQQGAHPVNVLPYVAGAINYTNMQGKETISGEFSGCIMSIYNFNGSTRVCHVDTAKDSFGMQPSKDFWTQTVKNDPSFELADEVSTAGMLGAYLDANGVINNAHLLCVLCVASPVLGISSFYALRQGSNYQIL